MGGMRRDVRSTGSAGRQAPVVRRAEGVAAALIPTGVQVGIQVLVAAGLALAVAVLWSALGAIALSAALSRALFVAAGIWLLGAGSATPRLTRLAYMRWAVAVSAEELKADVHGSSRPPIELSPLASAVLVGGILLILGAILA